jgi:hypothetical protein
MMKFGGKYKKREEKKGGKCGRQSKKEERNCQN